MKLLTWGFERDMSPYLNGILILHFCVVPRLLRLGRTSVSPAVIGECLCAPRNNCRTSVSTQF